MSRSAVLGAAIRGVAIGFAQYLADSAHRRIDLIRSVLRVNPFR